MAMPHFQTAPVAITSIRAEDSATLFRWINDPEAVRYNAAYKPVHWANHEDWVRSLGKTPGKIVFGIRAHDQLVGVVQLIDIDPVHQSAELTIRIGDEQNRNHGYGTEALRLALDFAWRDLNLHRVWLRVFANNGRAIRAYEKAGFVREGCMRDAAHIDGRYVDMIVLGILRPAESAPAS
jgi:UDP-4-amino-4,6-dideoxy-N-acetyl-beta-L-altrosamine N-acetyltransferase